MRLRRRATRDYEINDPNNGRRHEQAFTNIIQKKGILDERKLLQDSFGRCARKGGHGAPARAADRPARLRARQDHAEEGALPREARRASRTCSGSTSTPRTHHEELNLYILGEDGERATEGPDGRGGGEP